MYMQKIYFLQNNNKILGYTSTDCKSIVFGFRSKDHIQKLHSYIQHVPVNTQLIDEIVPNRYLVRTHYNPVHTFEKERLDTSIHAYTVYHSMVTCNLNNMHLYLVDHMYDREDGDIELICIPNKNINAKLPDIDSDILRYNLEILFHNSSTHYQ